MSRNPPWTRDELILALDLYFREPSSRGRKEHPACQELAEFLNKLLLHPLATHQANFRNASGVAMKLGNFFALDPSYHGAGLQSISKLDRDVWDEFAGDLSRLHRTAEAIRENYLAMSASGTSQSIEVGEDEEGAEGRILMRVHKFRERNRALIDKKKRNVLKMAGRLACEVCDFDFASVYGVLGLGFAECHHDRPVSEMRPGEKTKLSDLRIVCANCHRMLHRARPWLSIDELTSVLSRRAQRAGVPRE